MPTRTQVCTWIAAFGLVAPCSAAAQDRTEREVVDLIVRDGPRAIAIRAETEVIRRDQLTRLAYPNPGITYSSEGAGFTEFLLIEQALPFFGVRPALDRVGIAATAAIEAERDARLWSLRADARSAVARLVTWEERLQMAEVHAREVERLIGILRTREREGEGSRFDRVRAEQELREVRQAVTTAAIAAADARATVSALLPRDTPVARITVVSPGVQPLPRLDLLMERARSTRAELRALERAGERADLESHAARRARFPGPTIFGGLKRADGTSGRESGGVFGLNITLPLFDTGGREAEKWAAERARVDAERAAVEDQIRAEISRASQSLALRQRALVEDQASADDELMQIAEVAYREGEVGILELLDAVRTSSRARVRNVEIRLEARLAQIALERAVGDVLWP
jgi:cobalt-zinc-cadmium efflux system outer membrane protein